MISVLNNKNNKKKTINYKIILIENHFLLLISSVSRELMTDANYRNFNISPIINCGTSNLVKKYEVGKVGTPVVH